MNYQEREVITQLQDTDWNVDVTIVWEWKYAYPTLLYWDQLSSLSGEIAYKTKVDVEYLLELSKIPIDEMKKSISNLLDELNKIQKSA